MAKGSFTSPLTGETAGVHVTVGHQHLRKGGRLSPTIKLVGFQPQEDHEHPWFGSIPVWSVRTKRFTHLHMNEIRRVGYKYAPDVGKVLPYYTEITNPNIYYDSDSGTYIWTGPGEPESEVIPD